MLQDEGISHLFVSHEVFERDLNAFVGNRGTAFVAVFFFDLLEFLHDYVAQLLF